MIFGKLKSYTFVHLTPVRCSTLPREIQKGHFQQYYSYLLLIIYVISEKKTNCNPVDHHTWKCHHTNLWNAKLFHLTKSLLRYLKCWWLWKEPVVMCGNWNARQATSQQVFKLTTICMDACFQSFSPLINRVVHHAVLKFSSCCNKLLPQLVRIADWYSIHALIL